MEIEEKLKSVKDSQNRTLYDHLLNVLGRLAEVCPRDPLRSFEEHSQYVRSSDYSFSAGQNYLEADSRRDKGPEHTEFIDKTAKYHGFFPEVLEEGQEPQDPADMAPIGYVADMMAEERTLRRVGLGFGNQETYRIFHSLKKFVQAKGAPYAKFWGKIFGTKKDYYIIETKVDPSGDPEEITESHEPRETGINRKCYFVSTDGRLFFTLSDGPQWLGRTPASTASAYGAGSQD